MKVLSTLALVLLVPTSTLSSATQIDPQIKFTDMRLSQVVDYHHALFSLNADDLGLELPLKDKFGNLFNRFEWPEDDAVAMEQDSTTHETGDKRNLLVMALSGLGLIGFMSMRRRRS